MRFNNDQPIFQQIAFHLTGEILAGRLAPDARLPSARELAASLEVNPNTAARALQALADAGVARCERGTGYYVAADGPDKARGERRRRFFEEELPGVFRAMADLGIAPAELASRYEAWRIAAGPA
jgi:DNA-binding transcriptional regulator YhcF (GntR family)